MAVKRNGPARVYMKADDRRESILRAAIHVFVERFYAGATTAEIAKAAGCNEALIFRHFGTKLGLFVATMERATELLCDEAEVGVGEHTTNLDQLRSLARQTASTPSDRYRDLSRLRFVAASEAHDPVVANALQSHLHGLHEWTAGRLRAAKAAAELAPDVDPRLAAWQWSSAITMMSLRVISGDEEAAADFERMTDSLLSTWSAAGRTSAGD
jgi:AcrR family transcriptional regulator